MSIDIDSLNIIDKHKGHVAQTLIIEKSFYEITLKPMYYKILFVPDLHLTDREFKNTEGYVLEVERILLRIIEGAKKGLYNVVIIMGDLFDSYYKDVGKAFYHTSMLSQLHDILEGRLFKLLGNHSLNKKKNSVPTFFMLGDIKSTRIDRESLTVQVTSNGFIQNYGLSKEILTAPDRLRVNGALINFFHFNAHDKSYFDPLVGEEPTCHIGVYHDTIMPSFVKEKIQMMSSEHIFDFKVANNVDNSGIFSNVDYAMCGDIHTKVGEFKLEDKNTGKITVVDICGSLGRTAYHRAQMHNDVDIPLLEIDLQGNVTKKHVNIQLTDYRNIFKIRDIQEQKETRAKIADFKDALEILKTETSFEQAIKDSDLPPRVKEILNSLVDKQLPTISYREGE